MKRKIAAILAADIAGYSRLVSEDEEETLRRLDAYRGLFDDLVTQRDGRIFNTAGDSVLAEFSSAVEALRCAVDVQESVRTRNLAYPASRQMLFRIGISIGDVVERNGDLLGDGVNIAARLEALAKPGGICVSRSVFEQVANKLSLAFADAGPQQLRNIATPVHAYHVDFSSGETGVRALRPVWRPNWQWPSWPWPGVPLPSNTVLAGLAGVATMVVVLAFALRTPTPITIAMPPAKPPGVARPADPAPAPAPAPAAAAKAAAPAVDAPAPSALDVEITIWSSIRDSTDPALIQRYLDRYPEGQFAALARHRIASLRERESKPAVPAPSQAVTPPVTETPATATPAPPPTPPKAAAAPARSELAASLQRELKRVGCFDAEADGVWGETSRSALSAFVRYAKLAADTDEPSAALLDATTAIRRRICPLTCGDNEIIVGGRCVDKGRAAPAPPGKAERRPPARAERQPEATPPRAGGQKMCWGAGRNELVPCP